MQLIFELKHKNDNESSPKQIISDNVLELENLCRDALKNNNQVVLISPEKFENPKTVYELSAFIAEDLIKKYSSKNIILRTKKDIV